jgi:hypothetical protein
MRHFSSGAIDHVDPTPINRHDIETNRAVAIGQPLWVRGNKCPNSTENAALFGGRHAGSRRSVLAT